jgi:CRP-like cAMP-binding protein
MLKEGRVAVRMSSRDGHEVLIDELGPGNVFGWSAVQDEQRFKAVIWALADCTLIVIDGDKLRRLFDANNHIGYRVVRMIAGITADRLEKLRARLVDQPFSRQWLVPPQTATVIATTEKSEMRTMPCPELFHQQPALLGAERDRAIPVQELRDGLLLAGRV